MRLWGSQSYRNCAKLTASDFGRKWGLTESQVRRAFHPSEWHHCYLKYGANARAYFFEYSRKDIAEILKQARKSEFEDLGFHHSHIAGGKEGQEKYLLKIWRLAILKRQSEQVSGEVRRRIQH